MTSGPGPVVDPGSFRDPHGRVVHLDGEVYRGLSGPGARDWKAVADSSFFGAALDRGAVVMTREVPPADVPADLAGAWDLVLRHERVPFVSYPFEWTFSMLRDAALLHLDLLLAALDEGFTMKDGYAYNVQFLGARPVFVDVGSFEPGGGGPWAGYRQFCQTFLYPLMLQAHRGVDFHGRLRGSVEGIPPAEARRTFRGRDAFRAGVFKHVRLHAAMASRYTERAQDTKATLEGAGFGAEVQKGVVRGLRKTVRKLSWRGGSSHWTGYRDDNIYGDDDRAAKERFVTDALRAGPSPPGLVLDLGCNDGAYSLLAAEHAESVVAVDADHEVVDALYRRLHEAGADVAARVLPLVLDLSDPSPGLGWRSVERAAFGDRCRPDLVLALALVHHLAVGGNVPVSEVVDWLASFGAPAVVEFAEPGDPFVERLLANKPAGTHDDYSRDSFEAALGSRFSIGRSESLPCGTRTLYAVSP